MPQAATHPAHATGLTGVAYISPETIDPTQYTVGSVFNVTVQVAGMDTFNGWAISIRTDPSVIAPIRIDATGDLFEVNYTVTPAQFFCVNDSGTGCSTSDGPGIASLAGAYPIGVPPPVLGPGDSINGTLFTITYKVANASGFSRIEIVQSNVPNFTLAVRGSSTPVPNTTLPGTFGTDSSDFSVSANPTALVVYQGLNVTTTVRVQSINGFVGLINLTASKEFKVVFADQTLSMTPNGTATTQLTLIASATTPAYDYPKVTITASNATISHSAYLDVNVVNAADFLLNVTPSILRIHGGNSDNTTIIVQSGNGFSGNVTLTVQVPANVTYVLGSANLSVHNGEHLQTSLSIITPVLSLPFVYLINVTGVGQDSGAGSASHLFHTQALIVKPPLPSFTITVSPSVIAVRAGLTSSVEITLRSVDYFWQYVYLSATMSGGAASFDSNSYYMPLPDSKYAPNTESVNFTLSIYVPIDQVPGHYIVLVNAYQNSLTQTIGIPVTITSLSAFHNSSTPTVLGLSPPVYFGILGFLLIPLIILSISAYRKNLEDKDEEWKA